MKIISWNVNGLRSVISKGLAKFIEQERPDILCLQETKISPEVVESLDKYKLPGEWTYSHAIKKGYSGVATAVIRKTNSKITTRISGVGDRLLDQEGRILISTHKEFTLYNVYFPSGTSGEIRQNLKYRFLNKFKKKLAALPSRELNKLIICGDFNICHKEIDIHHPIEATKRKLTGFLPDERKWMDEFAAIGFTDTFRKFHSNLPYQYTWWSSRSGARKKNLGWRIDYFFVGKNIAKRLRDAKILADVQGSDHCPTLISLK